MMANEYFRLALNKYLFTLCSLNYKFNFLNNISRCRRFSLDKTLHGSEKVSVQLLPDVEKSLENGEMKHRKHPGIRKKEPISLPEVLSQSVYKLLCDESESALIAEAKELCSYLQKRRLPIETTEVERRIKGMFPSFEGDLQTLPYELTKQELQILKRRMRSEIYRWQPIEYDHRKCLAYIVGRLAPNYASVYFILNELKAVMPEFKPESYFDFGSGIGSALWAANSLWSDTIKEYFCVDASGDMNEICSNLIIDEVTEQKHINPVFFRQFLPASETRKYDLVVSAFSLLDIPTAIERLRIIDTLWRKTKDILVIVEYGNTAGFHSVLDARDYILEVENNPSSEYAYYSSGAYVVNPCPHDLECPKFREVRNSSCGFPVSYQIHFPQRHSKMMEKDWISYVVIKKGQRPNDFKSLPKVVKPVLKRTRHVHCRLCCSDGKLHETILTKAKHGRHMYRCARESSQGDGLPINVIAVNNESKTDE